MKLTVRKLAVACFTGLIFSQKIKYGSETVDANFVTVAAAAAAEVHGSSPKAEENYFDWERIQLTHAILANLTKLGVSDIALFDFQLSHSETPPRRCKVFPGDLDWPSSATWKVLNVLSGNALIKTVPLAAPCYKEWPGYNTTECAAITSNWSDPHLHARDPSSNQWPLYQGQTCLPPLLTNRNLSCTLGGYASYSIAATNVAQIQLAINFARNTDVRLVVKNTGHDFADKGIGAGALSIWTHKLNDIRFFKNYVHSSYTGPAFKIGSGAWTADIYQVAEENGVTVVGGVCRTVGLAGGYFSGGGNGPMNPIVGMGADQVLSMEVVLPDGRFVTVSEDSNSDLFWALRGSGGSTYGVVTSIVVIAYPKIPVTTMAFSYAMGPKLSVKTFWAGVRAYMSRFPEFLDAGAFGYFNIVPDGSGGLVFTHNPFWGGNMTRTKLDKVVASYLKELSDLAIAVTPEYAEYENYSSAVQATFPPEVVGSTSGHAASRLFPRENFADPVKLDATLSAVRYAIEQGGVLIGYNTAAAVNVGANQNNSVNSAWRKAASHFILAGSWAPEASDAEISAASKTLTEDWMQKWRNVSPGAGAYMSEADINEPNFQQSFFGDNYAKLYRLKKQYDPYGIFYTPQGVGSEDWYITNQTPYIPTQNGRLCLVA